MKDGRRGRHAAPLQWGRGRGAAEGAEEVCVQPTLGYTSMGPRPRGRGRLIHPNPAKVGMYTLQWGRGRGAAVGIATAAITTRITMLQWGRGRGAAVASRHWATARAAA